MPLVTGFIGPAYQARMTNMAAEQCINLYVESVQDETQPKRKMLIGTPGIRQDATAGGTDVVCRGNFSQDDRTWAVIGPTLYERIGGALVSRGSITNDGLPVFMASNGQGGEQLAICGGGELKILNLLTNALSAAIALPLTNAPVCLIFLDGYFLVNELNTVRVWFSALEDGTSWNALDFFARSQTSDNVVGIYVLQGRIWVMGSQTSGIYYDSGDADNPFVPYPSTIMQEGLVSPYAAMVVAEQLVWASQDNQGAKRVVAASSPSPTRISTPAIEFSLGQASTLTDAECLGYEGEGHTFWALTCPSLGANGTTWCVDFTEKCWHQRSSRINASGPDGRWRVRGLCQAGGDLIVGDYLTGNLGVLDLSTYTEYATGVIRRVRQAAYLSAEDQWLFLDQIRMGIDPGVGLTSGQGVAPMLMLQLSRDGGVTFDPELDSEMGALGDYTAQPQWRRLGRVRADRLVIRVAQTDPVKAAYGPGLWLKASPGSGQL